MAKRASKKNSAKDKQKLRKEKAQKKSVKRGAKYIPKHLFFGKNLLAPYTNEDGCPFYLNKGKDELSQLKLKTILKGRNADNEELCRRLGMGLALDAASLNHGAKSMVKHCSSQWPPEVKADLDKTGILQAHALLEGDDGVLLEALDTLDVGKSRRPGKKAVRKAVQALVRFLTNDAANKQKQFARMMTFTAKLYLLSSTALKLIALSSNLPEWAAKFHGEQSKDMERWRKKPDDEARLVEALTAELLAKIDNNEPRGKKKKVSDPSEEGQASASEEEEIEEDSISEEEGAGSDSDSNSDAAPPVSTESDDSSAKIKLKHSKEAKEKKAKKDKKDPKKNKKESKKDNTEPKAKEANAADAKTASFSAWRQGDVQCLSADVTNFKQEIGNLPGGQVKTEAVMALVSRVPDQVQEHYPSLRTTVGEVETQDAAMISNTLGKKLVAKLAALTSEAEAWWEEQTGGATANGST